MRKKKAEWKKNSMQNQKKQRGGGSKYKENLAPLLELLVVSLGEM